MNADKAARLRVLGLGVLISLVAVVFAAMSDAIGSVVRSERLAKYNQLLRIEEEMGPNAPFAGWLIANS